jgi:esterase/lipase superfamily enzyme
MNREYHKWWSNDLGREMEMLVFGHDGLPAVVFPTSCGRFFEFEDRGMVGAVADKIENGRLQLFCVDSADAESWYNTRVGADWRVARHVSYENYVLRDVLPLVRLKNHRQQLASVGCSFGGFHAMNIALRHPHLFSGALSMSGAFDLRGLGFLSGHEDAGAYFNLPLDYVPNIHDHEYLEAMRRNTYVLATGVHDQCWNDNERLAQVMRNKGIPVRLDVWGDSAGHDWPWWMRMAQVYL